MSKVNKSPYVECPVYETKQYVIRLVEREDSEDLLECYSDLESVKLFNSDNCGSDFFYRTVEEIAECIDCWINEYTHQGFVRFSIINKSMNKAIGTIEMFAKEETFSEAGKVGVLRLDLASGFENKESIAEILTVLDQHLFDDFEVNSIVTKAIPEAQERISVLENNGYSQLSENRIISYPYYFIKTR